MSDEELRELLAEDMQILEESDRLVVKIVKLTLTDFLQELMRKKVLLAPCPCIATVTVQVVYLARGVRLTFRRGFQGVRDRLTFEKH